MTKTEAAEILALEAVVFARRNGVTVTKSLIEERMSELMFNGGGMHREAAIARPSYRTVLAAAKAMA